MHLSHYIASFKQAKKRNILKVLLTIDCLFIVAHIISGYLRYRQQSFLYLENPNLSLFKDGSYSEIFQYFKELVAVIMLLLVYWREKVQLIGVWSLFFVYIFLDDKFMIHERVGKIFSNNFYIPPFLGLEAKDFGELSVYLAVGTCLLVLLAIANKQNTNVLASELRNLALLVGLLIFFGLGLDLVHAVLSSASFLLGALFGIIEDGGEMIAMSLIAWYTYNLWRFSAKLKFPSEGPAENAK